MKTPTLILLALAVTTLTSRAAAQSAAPAGLKAVTPQPARGPPRVHPANPRYFIDGAGKAIQLAGHQIFCDLQDNNFTTEFTDGNKRALDWAWYLDFAAERQLNFLRNWVDYLEHRQWYPGPGPYGQPDDVSAHRTGQRE
jgi:hypothetical protein